MAVPDLRLWRGGGGGGGVRLACPASFSLFCHIFFFFTQKKKGVPSPPDPSPRSVTAYRRVYGSNSSCTANKATLVSNVKLKTY